MKYFIGPLILTYSYTYTMVSCHHPGDTYFPNQGTAGWIVEDPEEIPEDESKEEVKEEIDEEEEDDDSDAESEVIDPPYIARVPAHQWGYNGPTPLVIQSGGMEPAPGTVSTFQDGARVL